MGRNITFEAFRFIFILFMVFHHLDTFNSMNIPSFTDGVKKICFEGFVGVNFFFMLSGLGCVLGYKDRLCDKLITGGRFLYNRLSKLYPAYLLFLIISIFLYSHGTIRSAGQFFTHIFMLQSLPITSNVAFDFNGVAWCISVSMFFYFIFTAIYKINFRRCVNYLLFLLLFIVMNLFYHNENGYVMTALFYTNPIFRLVDFLTGMAIALWFKENPDKSGSTRLQIWSVLIFIVFLLLGAYANIPWLYKWGLWYVFPCALLLFAFYNETNLSKRLFNHKFWLTLSGTSMVIFLSYQEILNFIKIYLPMKNFPVFYEYFWPWGVLVSILFIVAFSYIVDRLITGPLSKVLIKIKK